jgi:hypothetical protein
VLRLHNRKTVTIVISLLAFAIMYSTFITESGLATGRYTAGAYTGDMNPVNSIEKKYKHIDNNPFGFETEGGCIDSDQGDNPGVKGIVESGKKKYTDYCTDDKGTKLLEYYCGEAQSFNNGANVRYKLHDCKQASKYCSNGACR